MRTRRFIAAVLLLSSYSASSQIDEATALIPGGMKILLKVYVPPPWLVNNPPYFREHSKSGEMIDVRNDLESLSKFVALTDEFLEKMNSITDGEVVDAVEHYFWGKMGGIAIELGALDGSFETRSMTEEFEKILGWRRILVEGNPSYRGRMKRNSPLSFSVNAAICSTPTTLHFIPGEYVGGIVEFMSKDFLKRFHEKIHDSCVPPGNISSFDFSTIKLQQPVECIQMSRVLRKAHVKHVNFFILDVEGGEYEVLKSINFERVKFDVICIETDAKLRPPGYGDMITAYMAERGYANATQQQGRNTWYIGKGFVPSSRPGLDPQCYNGVKRAHDPNAPRCPML